MKITEFERKFQPTQLSLFPMSVFDTALDEPRMFNLFDRRNYKGVNEFKLTLDPGTYYSDTHFNYVFNVVGVDREDIDISIDNGSLVLHVNRKGLLDSNCRFEHGSFPVDVKASAIRTLPSDADLSSIEATLKNGILTVSVRIDKPSPKKVEVTCRED